METWAEKRPRFGRQVWLAIRERADVSQAAASRITGYSNKTIQSWEYGRTSPRLQDGNAYATALRVNPLKPYLDYLYPDIFSHVSPESPYNDVKRALLKFLEVTTEHEILQLHHLINQPNWNGLKESFLAEAHLRLWDRVLSTHELLEMYHSAIANGECDLSGELPDIELVTGAVKLGKHSAADGAIGYGVPAFIDQEQWSNAFAESLRKSKEKSGFSNDHIAFTMGKAPITIAGWLAGRDEPDLFNAVEFHTLCHCDPFRALYSLLYPAECNRNAPDMSAERKEVIAHFANATEHEGRCLAFLIFGEHGSSWHAMLAKYNLGARIPERYQIFISSIVLHSYEMSMQSGVVVCSHNVQPDLDLITANANDYHERIKPLLAKQRDDFLEVYKRGE